MFCVDALDLKYFNFRKVLNKEEDRKNSVILLLQSSLAKAEQ